METELRKRARATMRIPLLLLAALLASLSHALENVRKPPRPPPPAFYYLSRVSPASPVQLQSRFCLGMPGPFTDAIASCVFCTRSTYLLLLARLPRAAPTRHSPLKQLRGSRRLVWHRHSSMLAHSTPSTTLPGRRTTLSSCRRARSSASRLRLSERSR